MEYISKIDIFGVKMMVKKYLWNFSICKAFLESIFLLHRKEGFIKFSNENYLLCAWANFNKTDTSVEMTFFQLSFFEIGGKLEWLCLIWGIYGKFAKKMVDSSLLILSLFTSLYSNKNESCWDFTFGYWKTKDTERL